MAFKATMRQLAYINSLYNDLEVPYSEREKPETIGEAVDLIEKLKNRINGTQEDNFPF